MTRDQAVARIQQGLGFRDDLTDEIIGALKEAKRLLEMGRSLPGFLLQTDEVLTITAGDPLVSLPTGFIREFQEEPLWYVSPNDSTYVVFPEKIDYNIGLSRFTGADAGPPIAYTMHSAYLRFYPDPDINYTLNWSYYSQSADLSTNVTNNAWLDETTSVPEALIGRAGMIIAADLEDTTSLQKFSSMYNVAWNAITNEDQLNDEENRPLRVGSRL